MGFLDIDIHGARAGIFFGRDRLHRRLYAVDREPANLVAVAVEIAESERADARWISGQLRDDEIVVFALLDIEGRGAEGAAYLLMLSSSLGFSAFIAGSLFQPAIRTHFFKLSVGPPRVGGSNNTNRNPREVDRP